MIAYFIFICLILFLMDNYINICWFHRLKKCPSICLLIIIFYLLFWSTFYLSIIIGRLLIFIQLLQLLFYIENHFNNSLNWFFGQSKIQNIITRILFFFFFSQQLLSYLYLSSTYMFLYLYINYICILFYLLEKNEDHRFYIIIKRKNKI